MRKDIIKYLEKHLQACPVKSNIGIDCPGCGMQRSIIELLKGNIIDSILLYPALITMILLFVFLILHLLFKFKKGAQILLWMFIINVSIVFINYIIKMENFWNAF